MNPEDTISLGELIRVVGRLEQAIAQQSQLYVLSTLYQSEQGANDRRISAIESDVDSDRKDRKALFRLVIGSLVFPIVLLILNVFLLARGGVAT